MPTHWTYSDLPGITDDLEQGDIIAATDRLGSIFRDVHPHFCDQKYVGFLVATQSCDLVRRKGKSKATYVSLVAIRPLAHLVHKLLIDVASPVAAGLYLKSRRDDARRLLERVFNQNEQALGLFFLHQDADAGIGEHAIGMLRVAISIRSEHYDVLQGGRTGRLNPEFRAKLGWLLGNLYGRPATRDWPDADGGQELLNRLIDATLGHAVAETPPRWIDDALVAEARRANIDIASATEEQLEKLRLKPGRERALDEIGLVVQEVIPELSSEQLKKLLNRLRNSGKFTKLFNQSR